MYKEFYGFTTFPFSLTPDPQFLYPSENYKNCLFYLLYGLEREYGLLVITGEIGAGKTFLLNSLMQNLDKSTHVASMVHSNLDNLDVLQYASQELKLDIAGQSKAELLINLKNFLLTYEMKNEKVILLIDEAQNLSVDVLEELRLLTNFENAEKKLLQVVLAGQLQLEEKLKLPELAQLSQRIGFSCRLLPMDYNETKGYIETRLSVAGVTYPLFTPQAMKEIFVRSQGIPRVINLICDLALLFGFSEEKREIGPHIIKQVMQELNVYIPEKTGSHSIRQKRQATGARIKGFMWSKRLALMAGIAALSLLGAGAIWQSELTSGKLRAYMTRTVLNPLAAIPQSPSAREQPFLPQSGGVREQPLLPQSGGVREQPKKMQWAQTVISYQIPTGKPLVVSLPQVQRFPDSLPVQVTLDASNSTPVWLKFDSEKLALSGTPPLQETGKTYHLTLRAQTADGLESRLQLTLNLLKSDG